MGLFSYTVHHQDQGLPAVAQVTPQINTVAEQVLTQVPGVKGLLTLCTCNRVELWLETEDLPPAPEVQTSSNKTAPSPDSPASTLSETVMVSPSDQVAALLTAACPEVSFYSRSGSEVITHIFEVAAGLDSMVVGEREISGQLRRALTVAQKHKQISANLNRICQAALTTSRKIAHLTGLASQGRSVVAEALELARQELGIIAGKSALLIGTGSYAGASVAALRARNVNRIKVYSSSGRAEKFAHGHDLIPVPPGGLAQALAEAEIVLSCRGFGSPVLQAATVQQALAIREALSPAEQGIRGERAESKPELLLLDLALPSDLAPEVAELPGVKVIDLQTIQDCLPEAGVAQLQRAQELIKQGVAQAELELKARRGDQVVVALRQTYQEIVAQEIARLPKTELFSRAEVTYALQHLAARLAHVPTVNARLAAKEGAIEDYVQALHSVMGIHMSPSSQDCPATGLNLATIATRSAARNKSSSTPTRPAQTEICSPPVNSPQPVREAE